MDFGMYPPEINSGRMYAGPGSGPLLAAAQAWAAVADELSATSGACQSVVSELTAGIWTGPSSASMAAEATRHVDWLNGAAACAERTASQATAAVAAYETALSIMVAPAAIAANRTLLAALVATNFFGQNTAAIAATEAQYAAMWAQDAAAMYTYAGSSAAATALTPVTSPQPNTSPGASALQAAAVSHALAGPAADGQGIVSGAAHTFSAVPAALQSMATPARSISRTDVNNLSNFITVFLSFPAALEGLFVEIPLGIEEGPVDLPFLIGGYLSGTHTDDIVSGWKGVEGWPGTGQAPVTELPASLRNPPGMASTLSAGLGTSTKISGLSVPAAWTVPAPDVRALPLPVNGIELSAAVQETGADTTVADMGLAGMSGRAMAGQSGGGGAAGGAGTSARPPARAAVPVAGAAGGDGDRARREPRVVVTGVAARIREITQLRDEGDLSQEDYTVLKNRLLGR